MISHEHDWTDKPEAEIDGRYVYVYLDCTYTEILDSQTSERYDETFYKEGHSCEATKTITYEFDKLMCTDEDVPEVDKSFGSGVITDKFTEGVQYITENYYDEIERQAVVDFITPKQFSVEIAPDIYLDYELCEETVYE